MRVGFVRAGWNARQNLELGHLGIADVDFLDRHDQPAAVGQLDGHDAALAVDLPSGVFQLAEQPGRNGRLHLRGQDALAPTPPPESIPDRAHVAASFQEAVVDSLVAPSLAAAAELGLERVLVAYHRFDAAQLRDEEAEAVSDHNAQQDPCAAIRPEDDDLLRSLTGAIPSKVLITSRLVPQILINRASQPIPGVLRKR